MAPEGEVEIDSHGTPAPHTEPRVDFFVLEQAAANARLLLACRLAEKAYLRAQSVLVWHTDPVELSAFDQLLWTFADGSFVPHGLLDTDAAAQAPVLLSSRATPVERIDVLINLAPELPPCLAQAGRIAEIIDGDDSRRRAGRVRFKAYRELGLAPATHNLKGDSAPP